MKHYLLSERYLTQCVEAGFIEVVYKNTTDLDADAMTKALPGPTLARHAQTLVEGWLEVHASGQLYFDTTAVITSGSNTCSTNCS